MALSQPTDIRTINAGKPQKGLKNRSCERSQGVRSSPLREPWSSRFYVEGELIVTTVSGRGQGSMAQFVANRCHTPLTAGGSSRKI